MSTRGLWGYKHDGIVKVTYNHSDSYPAALGQDVLDFARDSVADLPALRERVDALRLVDESDAPTAEDVERLARFADLHVSTQDVREWYVLLRETQGAPDETLDAGVMIDSFLFGFDSLFCEYGYLIDLDAERFDVYRGFRETPTTDGEWVAESAKPVVAHGIGSTYFGIQRVASYPLADLPSVLKDEDE